MNPIVITSTDGVRHEVRNGKLVEIGYYSRTVNLSAIGKILRKYKTTKAVPYYQQKNVRIFYGDKAVAPSKGSAFAYAVPVKPNGPLELNIGCVEFTGYNAQTLRRQALKNSKVLGVKMGKNSAAMNKVRYAYDNIDTLQRLAKYLGRN